jgi:hypothetical protein
MDTPTHPSGVPAPGPSGSGQDIGAGETVAGRTLVNPMGGLDEAAQSPVQFLAPAQAEDEMGRLGGYRVLKILGRGGMGVVFLAHDPNADRQIALKVMLPDVAQKPEARERFLREARATAGIEHDHIVPLYHVAEDNGVPFLTMPLLKGMTLEDWLKQREKSKEPVELAQILRIGQEMAQGLAAAHERGLIHRDIKPANVWLDAGANHRVKILDFGLARPADDASLTQPGMIVGTASYMAPEQARGLAVDARADLYSLGCVLYRLCTGRLPFGGPDAMSVLIAATTEQVPEVRELNPDVPAPLAELIMQLLAKKPDDRPASARDVAGILQALERQLAPGDGMTADVTLTMPAHRPTRRPWAAVLALLVLAAAIAGGAFYLHKHVPPEEKTVPAANPAVAAGTAPKETSAQVEKPGQKEADFERWVEATSRLEPMEQWRVFFAKLSERNPKATSMSRKYFFRGGAIYHVEIGGIHVKDLSPFRALKGLKFLSLHTGDHGRNYVTDLSPLKDLPLVELHCGHSRVTDLSPLSGITSLRRLDIEDSPIHDLTPLKDLRLTSFSCRNTEVTDLTPLRNAPLETLECAPELVRRHIGMLKAIPSLKTINDQPAADAFKLFPKKK